MLRHPVYRFGDFVVDTAAHAVVRNHVRLAVQEQPFQILLALLQQPGEVVSREALRLRLWGTSVFVDFDQSLNSAVRRLRLTLNDNSRAPVYVETIPRIGFRFLAPVTATESEGVPATHPDTSRPVAASLLPALADPAPGSGSRAVSLPGL